MWRVLFIAFALAGLPCAAWAQDMGWETCRGALAPHGPELTDCRPLAGVIDPQGRELWIRSIVARPQGDEPHAFYIAGVASSELWLNGRLLGANGRPAGDAATEIPGLYQIAFPIPETSWGARDNVVVIRLSSFHGGLRLDRPIAALFVGPYPYPSYAALLAVIFIAAGTLLAASFGFGVIHSLRRTTSSLLLSAMALLAALQAVLECLRSLTPYAYPLHAWRLVGIWALAATFAVLLVAYVVLRFRPGRLRLAFGVAVVAIGASGLAPGFDLKTGLALLTGVAFCAFVTAVATYRRQPGARLALIYFGLFLALGTAFPNWLVDLSYFLLAAVFLLPLLMIEVVRLARDDRARETALTLAAARPNHLTVASARGFERVRLADIVAVMGADDYVELRLSGGRTLLHATRLDRLETELPDGFVRIHRSAIANFGRVRAVEREGGRWKLVMDDGATLPISRTRAQAVRDMFDER